MADLHDYVLSQDIQDNVNISVNDDWNSICETVFFSNHP
jgi:hypothetical protein